MSHPVATPASRMTCSLVFACVCVCPPRTIYTHAENLCTEARPGLGRRQKLPYELGQPSQRCARRRPPFEVLDHDHPVDVPPQKGIEERGVVPKGHTAVRLTVRAEHVMMGEHAGASKHFLLVDGDEPDGLDTME